MTPGGGRRQASGGESVPCGAGEIWPCTEQASACPFRAIDVAARESDRRQLRCLAITSADAAAGWLRGGLFHSDTMLALRGIALREGVTTLQLDDQQVLDLVAGLVAQRALCVMVPVLGPPVLGTWEEQAAPPPSPPPAPVAAVRVPQVPVPRLRPPVAPEAPALPAMGELAERVDHVRQAAVLEEAAVSGVPFCAACEKAREAAGE